MSQNTNSILIIDDDTTLYNIDDALHYLDLAQSKMDTGMLDFEDEYDLRQSMVSAEEYLADLLPNEAVKMIELAKGRISSNYSLRTSFTRILEMMSNFCPEQIELLPDYD